MVTLALFFRPSDNSTGKQLLSAETGVDQFAVLAHRPGDLLHMLDPGAPQLPTPIIEELSGPGWGVIIPELLKGFLQKVSSHSLQAIAEQLS
jgi:hypothetical protein